METQVVADTNTLMDVQFSCSDCGKVCKSDWGVALHKDKYCPASKGSDTEKITCDDCGHQVNTENGLKLHKHKYCPKRPDKTVKPVMRYNSVGTLLCGKCKYNFDNRAEFRATPYGFVCPIIACETCVNLNKELKELAKKFEVYPINSA